MTGEPMQPWITLTAEQFERANCPTREEWAAAAKRAETNSDVYHAKFAHRGTHWTRQALWYLRCIGRAAIVPSILFVIAELGTLLIYGHFAW